MKDEKKIERKGGGKRSVCSHPRVLELDRQKRSAGKEGRRGRQAREDVRRSGVCVYGRS